MYVDNHRALSNPICRGVHFVKISEPAARTQYGVSFTPQLVFFKNGSPKYFEGEFSPRTTIPYSTGGEFVVLICVPQNRSRVLCAYYLPQHPEQSQLR